MIIDKKNYRLRIIGDTKYDVIFSDVHEPEVVIFLDQTPIFKWYMARLEISLRYGCMRDMKYKIFCDLYKHFTEHKLVATKTIPL